MTLDAKRQAELSERSQLLFEEVRKVIVAHTDSITWGDSAVVTFTGAAAALVYCLARSFSKRAAVPLHLLPVNAAHAYLLDRIMSAPWPDAIRMALAVLQRERLDEVEAELRRRGETIERTCGCGRAIHDERRACAVCLHEMP